MRKLLISFLLLLVAYSRHYAQNPPASYWDWEKKYAQFSENDTKAFLYLNKSIQDARSKKEYTHLALAYQDAMFFTKNRNLKLKYADSTISSILKTKDDTKIGNAYLGKGTVYYYNFRNYKMALQNYLLAYPYIQNSNDLYQIHKLNYHIALVKEHLGYYPEALDLFTHSQNFFEKEMQRIKKEPNAYFNNTRGYLNSLHHTISVNRKRKNNQQLSLLLKKALQASKEFPTFNKEIAYINKELGIHFAAQKKYADAKSYLMQAEKTLRRHNDLAILADVYFYLGKVYREENETTQAKAYFLKGDSLYTKYQLMTSEMPAIYENLLAFPQNTSKEQTYYLNRLLEIDRNLKTNYPKLSSTLFRNYDQAALIQEKEKLQSSEKKKKRIINLGIGIIIILLGASCILYRREQNTKRQYQRIVQTQAQPSETTPSKVQRTPTPRKFEYRDVNVQEIFQGLAAFEANELFLEKDLTIQKVAQRINTNRTHLSFVLNEYKKMNFPTYMKILRINYITNKILTDPKFLKLNLDGLADAVGIQTRQAFSKQFYEVNKIKPSDFIKKHLNELAKSK